MKTKTIAILLLLIPLWFSMGCQHQRKVVMVDLTTGRIGEADVVNVDGRAEEQVWKRAVVMPFERTGKARFMWNQTKLYGFVDKYEHQKLGFDFDEQICVAIQVGHRVAKLFFEEAHQPNGEPSVLRLREAWVTDWPSASAAGRTIHGQGVEAASLSGMAQQGWGWSVEFSLDWNAFAPSQPGNEPTTVRVYRLLPQRPLSHILHMEPVEKNTAGQPSAGADGIPPAQP